MTEAQKAFEAYTQTLGKKLDLTTNAPLHPDIYVDDETAIAFDDFEAGWTARGAIAASKALTDEQIYQAIVAANCAITKGYGTGAAAGCIRALFAESGNATGEVTND